jgi:glycolate oxidase iron-sulfur subunit
MHTELHPQLIDLTEASQASQLINACVHCGFCLETCPTYLDRRDERDSPRGRIYLIKQFLESGDASEHTRRHLDRCLTCRSCETTCPSGMQYGRLLDIGRGIMEKQLPRPRQSRYFRWLLRKVFTRPYLFGPGLRLAQLLRPLLPASLQEQVPQRQNIGTRPTAAHTRRMLILEGCVQKAATPLTNAAAARVMARLGISLVSVPRSRCCGSVDYHLGAVDDALVHVRRNIDAWWPHIEAGAEAIIFTASGCGTLLTDYGELLAHDPNYVERARKVSELARDLSQVILAEDLNSLGNTENRHRVAVHIPCSLNHGLGLAWGPGEILRQLGFTVTACTEEHLCCGSAGTYSILQKESSQRLRDRKLAALNKNNPDLIVTANVGCQLHLQVENGKPVRHWIELLDKH